MNTKTENTLQRMAYHATQEAIAVLERALPKTKDQRFFVAKLARLDQRLASLRDELQE
jgi:hypothetical protein